MDKHEDTSGQAPIERVQIGVRMEKRMVKVLKGLAEYHDLTLGDLLEGIVLHAFESHPPFQEESLRSGWVLSGHGAKGRSTLSWRGIPTLLPAQLAVNV